MSTHEYKVVSDDRRVPRVKNPAIRALLEEQTIVVPFGTNYGNFTATLQRHGFKMRSHRDHDGIVLWVEKIDG